MEKRALFLVLPLVFILAISCVSAEKLDIIPVKEVFLAGENITLKTSLFDANNNLVDTDVAIKIEDAQKLFIIEQIIKTNKLVDINLGEGAPAGYWKITATHQHPDDPAPTISTALFMVETSELVKFEIKGNILTIINIGNTRYTKTVQIAIGETLGTKQVDLGVGESASFRLVAPEGSYSVSVTDGKTTITQGGVALTGNVIGILDNKQLANSPLTSGVRSDTDSPYNENGTTTPAPQNRIFVYLFLFILIGAAILLAIERRYRKSAFQLVNYQLRN